VRLPAAEDARGGDEEPAGFAHFVRGPGGRSSTRSMVCSRIPTAACSPWWVRAGSARRGSPSRPRPAASTLPARRALRPARLGGIAGVPGAGGRRVDPVRRRRCPQRLLGQGAAARLPERALDAARPRQLRAPGRRIGAARGGDRANAEGRIPDDVEGAVERSERVGVRRGRPRAGGQRERRLRRPPPLCRPGHAGGARLRARREGA
jgi:hypothetical protein